MSASTYIIMANAAVWLGLAGYLVFLAKGEARLRRREQQINLLGDDHDA
ncbi:CcmD family protein [Pseudodesulfovibrio sp.]